MIKKYFLFLLFLLVLPSVSALQINDTIFFSSDTNFTIFVDSITLDQVTVTNQTITFINLTSIGSNFTNINATFDARADFIGLTPGLVVRNVNTQTDLFQSKAANQNFNATFTPSQVLIINDKLTFKCNSAERSTLNLVVLFSALGLLAFVLMLFFSKGKELLQATPKGKTLVIVFVGIIIAVVFIQIIADQVIFFCA